MVVITKKKHTPCVYSVVFVVFSISSIYSISSICSIYSIFIHSHKVIKQNTTRTTNTTPPRKTHFLAILLGDKCSYLKVKRQKTDQKVNYLKVKILLVFYPVVFFCVIFSLFF